MKTSFLARASALLVAALLPLVTAAAAESPSLLLQKGIYAEEVERNLDSAIKIYEQIAAESAANRPVVAQAQYRLAVCYQKQGKKEQAIKLLQELVQQSPTDAAVLRKARNTLTELGSPAPEGMTVRKLPFSIPGWPYAMSMDGRYVAYEPKGGYDLALLEVPTGKNWIVAKCAKGNSPT
ncbi:MAG: tetratricopeptide repeat protein [Opitutus sp.]|nr:tetratricopeptide repeat protein [Opitutus sp.]